MPNISGAVFALTIMYSLYYWLNRVLPAPPEPKTVWLARPARQAPAKRQPGTERRPLNRAA